MNKIKEWYLRVFKKQHTFIYCICGNELISNGSKFKTKDYRCYKYQCNKCGKRSNWLFDTPVPIRLKDSDIK
jgi:hypothetical protein